MKAFAIPGLLFFCSMALPAEPPTVSFYLVESTMQTASGRNLPASVSLVKRSVDREQGRIEESVISLRDAAPAEEFITVVKPDGTKAKITCSNCGIEGNGEFTGPDWQWTGFKFKTSAGRPGFQLEGEDHFSADGMTAENKMVDANGKVTVVIKETGRTISKATYEALRTRLLAK